MGESTANPWKKASIGLMILLGIVAVTGVVLATRSSSNTATTAANTDRRPTAPAAKPAAKATESRPAAGRGGSAGSQAPEPPLQVSVFDQPAKGTAASRPAGAIPTQADIEACNRYAAGPTGPNDKAWEIAKDAVIGGAATAAIGAAAGAIAGGGKGAGKGAAIGGIVGAAGGALYGINENRKQDEAYRTAYQQCMRSRGYAG